MSDRLRNTFQDLSFNLFYPVKSGRNQALRVWGTGGLSLRKKLPRKALASFRRHSVSYECSDVGILGLTHTLITSEKIAPKRP
ncbi:MAG: hypothetical protein R2788_21230 [Saprospiraceae bacterium]